MGVRREAPDFGSLVSLACRWAPAAPLGPPAPSGAYLRWSAPPALGSGSMEKCGRISLVLLTIEHVFAILVLPPPPRPSRGPGAPAGRTQRRRAGRRPR